MLFRGEFGFGVSGFDIGSFQPYELAWSKGLGRSGRSLSSHDFGCYCKGCRDFRAEFIKNFEPFFHGWNLRGQGYWREELSPTGRGVVLLSLISWISRMLKIKQSVSLHVESKDDKR
jgi:hypothetical protein